MVPHTGAILTAAAADEHDAVLLDVVALAGDIGGDHATAREPYTRRLPLPRVGFLRPRDAHLQAHPLLLRAQRVRQRRRHGVARALDFPAALF